MTGVMIGCGWQVVVAYVNFTTYCHIGLHVGVVLGFKVNMGVDVIIQKKNHFSLSRMIYRMNYL
jgi:Na+-driven multidrug efflux pump